ncbi:protein sip-5 [Stenotrophomonas sp. ISL-67]|uniref:protein sip-5 n=1 Tax=Stenotrophomonas sp. ISL-67 TaxID=2819171 RepID=UPI001BEB6B72|nr:protein sip-5 [Stenotrophomonas sp. ISL-67]MBT2767550.1 protein sip-5 [Stenotrophomonas sp. ISL-67]
MKFEALRHRVKRAEQVVAIRVDETQCSWFTLSQAWREGWTPLRIISVGLAGGFLAGKLEPGSTRFHGARWLQMIGSVSSLLASTQAAFASMQATEAADTADQAADKVDEAVDPTTPVTRVRAATPDAAPTTMPRASVTATQEAAQPQPQPAEAATDVSER